MKKYVFLILFLTLFLGLHGEHLALYTDPDAAPHCILPYRAALYPQLDQQALAHGIPIHSQEALCRLLEDYLT